LDTNGYKLDISIKINGLLSFTPASYQKIMQKLSVIDSFKGSWKTIENSEARYLKELKKIATIESIGSSTRIEGAILTDAEVETLLKSVKITKLTSRDEQEVIGYYDGLQVILDNYIDITFEERYIHQLHGILLKHSNKDQTHKGRYKNLSNQVVATYPDGTQRTIFKTTEPHLTADEMDQLLSWTNKRISEKDIHPLLLAAVVVYEFLSIHPYQDGNGRLSRLLTTLKVLLKNRQQQVLAIVRNNQSMQIGQLEKQLNSYSRNTLKKDLMWLVKEGLLFKTGGGRGVQYHIKD